MTLRYWFNNDYLITETGEINHAFIKRAAKARAQYRYGACCTRFDIEDYEVKLESMALVLQGKFRDGFFVPPSVAEVA